MSFRVTPPRPSLNTNDMKITLFIIAIVQFLQAIVLLKLVLRVYPYIKKGGKI